MSTTTTTTVQQQQQQQLPQMTTTATLIPTMMDLSAALGKTTTSPTASLPAPFATIPVAHLMSLLAPPKPSVSPLLGGGGDRSLQPQQHQQTEQQRAQEIASIAEEALRLTKETLRPQQHQQQQHQQQPQQGGTNSSPVQPIAPRGELPPEVARVLPATTGLRLNKFVRRLHDMLLSEKDSGVVEWRRGLLVLHSTNVFTTNILPKYFNTRNFKTFRRQLNYYGFVHVRSFSNTGTSTTALWVNQELANKGSDDISSVLMLRRVEPCEASKTAEGRRVRKELAIHTVEEDLGVNAKTLQMEQIRSLALRGSSDSSTESVLDAAAAATAAATTAQVVAAASNVTALPPASVAAIATQQAAPSTSDPMSDTAEIVSARKVSDASSSDSSSDNDERTSSSEEGQPEAITAKSVSAPACSGNGSSTTSSRDSASTTATKSVSGTAARSSTGSAAMGSCNSAANLLLLLANSASRAMVKT